MRLLRLSLATLALPAALLAPAAQALVVPLNGWTPVNGNVNVWIDPAGACLLREERLDQAFPALNTENEARKFALRLQASLAKSKVQDIVTQPVERAGTWAVLAAYTHEDKDSGILYRISQLYLSEAGHLRTITGSSALHEGSPCVNDMRDFIRYLAD
ncbi:MAG: hypothetical protein AB1511_01815 [Deinococcota bacterium]